MGLMEEKSNSMLYWYPKLKEIDELNLPKTVIVDAEMFPDDKDGDVLIGYDEEELEDAIEEVGGYPVFIRTDKASAKHSLENVSKVYSDDELHGKIHMLADDNLAKGIYGLQFNTITVREWLDIKHHFKAFHGDLPVGYEIRAFIRDNEIECKHFYWIKDAIERPNKENWETLWKFGKAKTMGKWNEAKEQVKKVAEVFDGWWSVDVALTVNNNWYVIDMAQGKDSFHHPNCSHAPAEIKEKYNDKEG